MECTIYSVTETMEPRLLYRSIGIVDLCTTRLAPRFLKHEG